MKAPIVVDEQKCSSCHQKQLKSNFSFSLLVLMVWQLFKDNPDKVHKHCLPALKLCSLNDKIMTEKPFRPEL